MATYTLSGSTGSFHGRLMSLRPDSLGVRGLSVWDSGITQWDNNTSFWETEYYVAPDPNSFILEGQNAELKTTRAITANTGNYTLTRFAASFSRTRIFTPNTIEYTLTGQEALKIRPRSLPALTGSFVLTGEEALKTSSVFLPASTGSYLVEGQEISRSAFEFKLDAGNGSFIVTEGNVSGEKDSSLAGVTGSYSFTPNAIGTNLSRVSSNTSFVIAKGEVDSYRSRVVKLQSKSFVLSGKEADGHLNRRIIADSGTYTVTTNLIDFIPERGLYCEGLNLFYSGNASLRIIENYFSSLGSTEYNLEGYESYRKRSRDFLSTDYVVEFNDIDNTKHYRFAADASEFNAKAACTSEVLNAKHAAEVLLTGNNANFIDSSRQTILTAGSAHFRVELGIIKTYSYNWENHGVYLFTGQQAKSNLEDLVAQSIWDEGITYWDDSTSIWDGVYQIIGDISDRLGPIKIVMSYQLVGGKVTKAPDWYVPADPPADLPSEHWADSGEFAVTPNPRGVYGEIYDASTGKYDGVKPAPPQNIVLSAEPNEIRVRSVGVKHYDYYIDVTGRYTLTPQDIRGEVFIDGKWGGIVGAIKQISAPESFIIQGNEISLHYEPKQPPESTCKVLRFTIGTGGFTSNTDIEVDSLRDRSLISNCK